MKICPQCKRIYSDNDNYCLNDRYRLINYSDEQSEIDQKAKLQEDKKIPKCPTCQSSNIKKISGAKRLFHGVTFGISSSTSYAQFECKNCGYKW